MKKFQNFILRSTYHRCKKTLKLKLKTSNI